MKKNFLFVLLGIVAMLTSCNKEEVGGLATNKATSFNVSVDGGVQTRAQVTDLTRFIMEVYEGATATGTPVKRIEQATSVFNDVLLKDNQEYTVVFWADYGALSTDVTSYSKNEYDASDLKAARVVTGKQPTKAAYSGVSKFTVGTDNASTYTQVKLTHSVAQVNFIQTEDLTATTNTLAVSYPKSYSVNVGDDAVKEITGIINHTFTYNNTVAGTLGTSYIIAAKGATKTVLEITATLNSETSNVVSNVPFERNYKTNISGAYSSKYAANLTVTCDDVWGIPDNNVNLPVKVGDFYYQDNTFSSTYTLNAQNPCIGIVFVVNADGKTGKIVSLDELVNTVWSTECISTNAISNIDGAANTAKVLVLYTYSTTVYPAFGWCATKNATAPVGINWYLPAYKELHQLYAAMSGLKWVASGVAGVDEINGWADFKEMPNYATYATARTVFNEKFATVVGGVPMGLGVGSNYGYYSSTEDTYDCVYSVTFYDGSANVNLAKDCDGFNVRAVSAF